MATLTRHDGSSALSISRDARLVALRWDLVPWGLVLDLDSPPSEGANVPLRRAWLVFEGVSEITLPIRDARLPAGIWMGEFSAQTTSGQFTEFVATVLLPRFDGNALREGQVVETLVIQAQKLVSVVSTAGARPDEHGLLSLSARTALASDSDMLAELQR